MAEVNLDINGRGYRVACEDGQERHLSELGQRVSRHAGRIAREAVGASEGRLMLLAGLMVADELSEAEAKIRELESQVSDLRIKASASRAKAGAAAVVVAEAPENYVSPERMLEIEIMVADLLNQAAEEMERMAQRLDVTP